MKSFKKCFYFSHGKQLLIQVDFSPPVFSFFPFLGHLFAKLWGRFLLLYIVIIST